MSNLLTTYVVVAPDLGATGVDVTATIWQDLDRRFADFKGHLLVAGFDFEADWPSWERHPAGDEIVALVSGRADMILDLGGNQQLTTLAQPGSFVIVPKGTWHTARISVPTSMLFVTPGEGTENRPK
jgi:mannose-6-phosphate isomerase-like protein (cupin superfamily)